MHYHATAKDIIVDSIGIKGATIVGDLFFSSRENSRVVELVIPTTS